jgi:DNA polymerase-3 subunit chi
MLQVSFYTRLPDKLDYACRLVRKAYRSGARVVVSAPEPGLGVIDKALWTFDAAEFLPHVVQPRGSSVAAHLAVTPVFLVAEGDEPPHHDILINMGPAVVPGFESFKRVIELISTDVDDVQAGRRRWKHYTERGYKLTHHEAGVIG